LASVSQKAQDELYMTCRILVVEDEIFVATEIEHVVSEMGHEPVGIAADMASAMVLAPRTDIALVDLNLQDGPTGKLIGEALARDYNVTVLFMTANPAQLGDGVAGTLGVLPKPVTESDLQAAVNFAVSRHHRTEQHEPPRRMRLFGDFQGSLA